MGLSNEIIHRFFGYGCVSIRALIVIPRVCMFSVSMDGLLVFNIQESSKIKNFTDLVSQNSLMAVNTLANKKIGSEDGIGIYEDKEGHKHNLNYINGTPYKDRKVSHFKGKKFRQRLLLY